MGAISLIYENCIFIGGMGMGGAERVISILANYFSDKGMTVDIVLLLNNSVKHELREYDNNASSAGTFAMVGMLQ